MKSALLRLREAREAISPTEREIADYLLQHPEDVIDLSIHELAKRTFSSPSTIIRMCHRIGFEGFKEFRKAITYEMAIRRQNKEAEQKEITRSDSLEDIVEKITYKNIMSLDDTKNLLDTETPHQLYAFFQGFRIQKVLCILQGHNIFVGDFLNNVLQAVGAGNFLLLGQGRLPEVFAAE